MQIISQVILLPNNTKFNTTISAADQSYNKTTTQWVHNRGAFPLNHPAVQYVSLHAFNCFSQPVSFILRLFVSWFLAINFLRLIWDVQGYVTVLVCLRLCLCVCVCQYFCLHVTVSQGNISLEKFNGYSPASFMVTYVHLSRNTWFLFTYIHFLLFMLINIYFTSYRKAFGCVWHARTTGREWL